MGVVQDYMGICPPVPAGHVSKPSSLKPVRVDLEVGLRVQGFQGLRFRVFFGSEFKDSGLVFFALPVKRGKV